MKRMRKLLSVLCALSLLVCLAVFAAADGTTCTLTLNNSGATAHTFEVYQIFTGDLSVNDAGGKVLSNIVWGSGVTADGQTAMGNAAEKADSITTEAEAAAFANDLVANGYLTGAASVTVAAGASGSVADLAPGYYLVKDVDGTQDLENGAYTAYLLQVVGDVTATTKLDTPSVEKKVKDINDSEDADISDNAWQDSADHDIGDIIPYQLTGTLPGNFASYETYTYQFTDELSGGLTYQADAKVYLVNGETETDITSYAAIAPAAATAGATLTVSFEDLKTVPGVTATSKIVVRYTAELNENAVIGAAGNPNTVYLTYSNNPNPNGTGTGTTPKDKVIVFTYELHVDKVDENEEALPGAGFSLYKKTPAGEWELVREIAAGSGTSFTFSGLDDGEYKLVESTVPVGYNKIEDVIFTITADHETESADPQLITLTAMQEATIDDGTIALSVVNKGGSILPSTGGAGTRMLYLLGGLLCVGAVVLLVTKKRMRAED